MYNMMKKYLFVIRKHTDMSWLLLFAYFFRFVLQAMPKTAPLWNCARFMIPIYLSHIKFFCQIRQKNIHFIN